MGLLNLNEFQSKTSIYFKFSETYEKIHGCIYNMPIGFFSIKFAILEKIYFVWALKNIIYTLHIDYYIIYYSLLS